MRRVLAQKGKGKRYRREMNDPYAGAEKDPAKKKPPKQTAEAGPINAVFSDDEETEEYFLFVRKVKKSDGGSGGGGEGGDVEATASVQGKENIEEKDEEKDADASTSLEESLAGLGMRGPSTAAAPDNQGGASKKNTKHIGVWLPLGDVVVSAGGDMDLVVAERRNVLTGFAKRKHLKMLPIAADEVLEFGLRVQRAPPRGPDPTEVFPVGVDENYANLVWDHRTMGDFGNEKAELRLMNAMPVISSHKKNEMLSSAMGMIQAQQEKAAAARAAAADPPSKTE